jgi:hypothetical protein
MKPGYQLHVRSWENDGDNYKTEVISGLNETDCRFLVMIASAFGRCHDRKANKYGLTGNEENTIEQLIPLFRDAHYEYSSVSETYRGVVPTDDNLVSLYTEYHALGYNSPEQKDPKFDVLGKYGCDNEVAWFADYAHELIRELLGQPGEYYESDFVRVCESIKVFYVPGAIEDVTNQFITKGKK